MAHVNFRRSVTTAALGAAAIAGVVLPAATAQAAPAAVSNLSSASCPSWIQDGQTSGCVTRLQQLLNTKENAGLVVDGVFGTNTFNAVERWQSNHGLSVDGIVGPATKASIDPTTPSSPTSNGNQKVINAVHQLMAGTHYQYAYGGGHVDGHPGPSSGALNVQKTVFGTGLDCSGFTRWAYSIAYGYDRLGNESAENISHEGTLISSPQPGDLVFLTTAGTTTKRHVEIYMGNGEVAQEGNYGESMEYTTLAASKYSSDIVTYEHIN